MNHNESYKSKKKYTEIIEINDIVYGPEITIEYQDEEEREQIISILNSYRDIVPYLPVSQKKEVQYDT